MKHLLFDDGRYRIFPRGSYMGKTYVEIVVHRRKFDPDDKRIHFVEAIPVSLTESVQEVFDKVVAKYTQP